MADKYSNLKPNTPTYLEQRRSRPRLGDPKENQSTTGRPTTPRPNATPVKKPKLHDLRLHLHIQDHDLEIKLTAARKFLAKRQQVRVTVQLKGRERGRPQAGLDLINRVIQYLHKEATPANQPTLTNLTVMLNPKH